MGRNEGTWEQYLPFLSSSVLPSSLTVPTLPQDNAWGIAGAMLPLPHIWPLGDEPAPQVISPPQTYTHGKTSPMLTTHMPSCHATHTHMSYMPRYLHCTTHPTYTAHSILYTHTRIPRILHASHYLHYNVPLYLRAHSPLPDLPTSCAHAILSALEMPFCLLVATFPMQNQPVFAIQDSTRHGRSSVRPPVPWQEQLAALFTRLPARCLFCVFS